MFEIDGIFYLDQFYTEIEEENGEINLRITLSDTDPPNYIFGNDDDVDIVGTELKDYIFAGAGDKIISALGGDDYLIQTGEVPKDMTAEAGMTRFRIMLIIPLIYQIHLLVK